MDAAHAVDYLGYVHIYYQARQAEGFEARQLVLLHHKVEHSVESQHIGFL